jgi:site-specific DNA recombinase
MTKRAALYARVSTARQEQERTIESQVEALERAAAAKQQSIPNHRRYIDEGFSGSRLDRPGLDALRDAAADALIDEVFVYCPDRLARKFVHQHVLLEELAKRDVSVHFVERPISERAEDQLLVQMQGVIAEYERAKIVERTRRGKLHKLRTGQILPFGASAPYGYAIARTGEPPRRTVVIDDIEAAHVRAMFRWVLEEDLSARAVAKRLNALGIRPRRAAVWTQGSVWKMLTNPAYIGQATYNRWEPVEPKRPKKPGAYRRLAKSSSRMRPQDQWLYVPIPALVEARMQNELRIRLTKHKLNSPRNAQHPYLLRTLVVCGECGWRMECSHQHHKSTPYEYFYYNCRHVDPLETGRERKCSAKRVRRDELDAVVWDAIVNWIQTPRMLMEEVVAWRTQRSGKEQSIRDRAQLEGASRRLGLQVERLVDAYQRGALSVEELKARREKVEADRAAIRARLEELAAQELDRSRLDHLGDDLEAFAATLRGGIAGLDFAGRQHLVRLLIERVVVTGDHVAIEHAIPLSGRFCAVASTPSTCSSALRAKDG